MKRVAIVVHDGVSAFELGCALEVFGLQRQGLGALYECEVISFTPGPLHSTANLQILAKRADQLHLYDRIIIPSWPTSGKRLQVRMADALLSAYRQGSELVSFCSGAFLLAQLGLLDGVEATTHWQYADTFCRRFPAVKYTPDVLYTVHARLACSAGSAAALDLSLELVRRDYGYEIANQMARRLVIPPHRKGGQAQFVETPMASPQNKLSATLDWAIQQLANGIQVDDLARHANMSRRSFDRHFRQSMGTSAKHWLNQQRVRVAQALLERDDTDIQQVAAQVGFDSPVTLRVNFNKYLGVAPSDYRQQFQSVN
ncbi:helix-turn-helix domain-containing protein [Aestuariibacter halophilus]|uniref:Helix-turn-helix domain-containing protein n=1 Tax=Fluctibacter halophilus TaxID=226011 RepID=A0ABS8G5R9_9ALTE|nr:helix-turn-helix domain-containing protein [Aestuariibacter halophilus]MCC2615848.1 helix-turn-helix domain-containing protein [Aestuariibacter halophilus]